MRSRRSCVASISLVEATRSPWIFSPEALFPENVKTGMFVSLTRCRDADRFECLLLLFLLLPSSHSSLLPRHGGLAHRTRSASAQKASAARDHFLQLVLVAGAGERGFYGDLLLEIGGRQRLVERLHAELLLAGLHGRVDLVNLVFPDQVADGGIGNQNLHTHGPSLIVGPWQQALTHDAFEHQRKLGADLGLLVRREHVDDAVD